MGAKLCCRNTKHVGNINFVDLMFSTICRINTGGVFDMILVYILPPVIVPPPVPLHLAVAYQGVAYK